MELLVTDQREDIILDKPWFERYNPVVDWNTNTVKFEFRGNDVL